MEMHRDMMLEMKWRWRKRSFRVAGHGFENKRDEIEMDLMPYITWRGR